MEIFFIIIIMLQFIYIIFLTIISMKERTLFYERYDNLVGVPALQTKSVSPKGRNSVHKNIEPDFEKKLKADGIY